MNLKVDFSTLADTLPIMLYGLGGIVVVMAVLYFALLGLYKLGQKSKKEEK